MRVGTTLVALLLAAGAGGVVLILSGPDEAAPLIARARSKVSAVEHSTLEAGRRDRLQTRSAARNRRLFAHELVHVDQYRMLGIGAFARRYAANPQAIEEEARSKARRGVPRL